MAMAMAMTTLLRPRLAPPALRIPSARPRARAPRGLIVASSFAADAASFSSDSAKLPKSAHKRKSVAGVDQENLVDSWVLAERDSRFAEFFGVLIHYKIAHPPADDETKAGGGAEKGRAQAWKVDAPAVLLHGFGASLFSWQRVLKPLAALLGSRVVAFDRPAFGLTARPDLGSQKKPIRNPYTLEFSANATLSFAEFLHAQQVILIGHSAGSLVALQAYLDAPEKVAAMILIAPAIASPIVMEEVKKASTAPNPGGDKGVGRAEEKKFRLSDIVSAARDAIWWLLMQVWKVLRVIKAAVQALFQTLLPKKFVARVESAFRNARENLIAAAFRSRPAIWAVRFIMDRFGTRGVRLAWYDPEKADDDVLQGYTKPLQCKNWESALLEFALAMSMNPSADTKSKKSLGRRLKEVKCPVLVVAGDTDRLVPTWNARRLASALPNAEFELVKRCGHMPQEETPEELLSIIERFLSKAFPSRPHPVPT